MFVAKTKAKTKCVEVSPSNDSLCRDATAQEEYIYSPHLTTTQAAMADKTYAQKAQDAAGNAAETVSNAAGSATKTVQNTAGQAKEAVVGKADDVTPNKSAGDQAKDAAGSAQDAAGGAKDAVVGQAEGAKKAAK